MSTDEYVPSDEDIEEFYALGRVEYSPGSDITPANARDEFRAFLARVRRDAKAEAWREYAAALEAVPDYAPTEYDRGRVDQRHAAVEELHVRATEYETGDQT